MKKASKICQQVDQLLKDDSQNDEAKEYLGVIRENWKIAETSIEKHVRTALILVIVFELLMGAGVSEVSISGFKFGQIRFLRECLSPFLKNYSFHEPNRFLDNLTYSTRKAILPIYL